jgi:hypothetical protein
MSTLTEIEAAAAGLSASEKSRLLLFLAAQLRAPKFPDELGCLPRSAKTAA